MQEFIQYFSEIPSSHRSMLLFGGLLFFLLLEFVLPTIKTVANKWKHAGINIFFTLTTAVVNLSLAFLLVGSTVLVERYEFGVLQWLELPLARSIILGLLLLDLISAYFVHYVEHKVPFLWRFHIIHHTDKFVDATTANRHHPGESVVRLLFTILAVWLTGASIGVVFLYQSLSVLLSQFNHANIRLPKFLDKTLSWIIVTPAMHRVHHHFEMPITDTNYGNIFSFWDRLFGTYLEMPEEQLVFGLDTHFEEKDADHLGTMLGIPFKDKPKSNQ